MDHNETIEIQDMVRMLDKAIHKHMGELTKLGKELKDMQTTNQSEDFLHPKHVQMATIFNNLKPAEDRVRYLYPQMNKLFDYLMQVHASETFDKFVKEQQ